MDEYKDIAIKELEKIRNNPDYFFSEYLGVDLWSKEKEIVQSVKNHQKTTIRSNNSSGKTYTIARIALWFLSAYPSSVVINTAPTHRQVENQYWREFRKAYKSAKRPFGGKLLKTQFNIAEDWYAIGFSTKDGDDGMEKFQGWHGQNVLIIVDEASGVHPKIFEAIQGAMASGGTVRLVYIGNPTKNTGDFAESFKDPTFNKIHISAYDSPNVKEGKVVIQGLVTLEWVEDMIRKYGKDSDVVRVRVFGNFPKKEADTLIGIDLVEESIGAERELYGDEEFIGLDPARYGEDTADFVYRKGNYAKVLETIQSSDLMVLAGKAKNYLKEYPKAKLHIDIVGLGVGVFDRLREQEEVADRVFGVSSSASATNTDEYKNLRAEGWDDARLWLRDAVLDDDPEHKEKWYQLTKPKYKILSSGQIQLESKEEMKKRGVASPGVGDALVLTLQRPTEGSTFLMLLAD